MISQLLILKIAFFKFITKLLMIVKCILNQFLIINFYFYHYALPACWYK